MADIFMVQTPTSFKIRQWPGRSLNVNLFDFRLREITPCRCSNREVASKRRMDGQT